MGCRRLQIVFRDINDGVGQATQHSEITRVQSQAVGEARHGVEHCVGSTFGEFCEKQKRELPVFSLRWAALTDKIQTVVPSTFGAYL